MMEKLVEYLLTMIVSGVVTGLLVICIISNDNCVKTASELTREFAEAEFGFENVDTFMAGVEKEGFGEYKVNYRFHLLDENGNVETIMTGYADQDYMKSVTGTSKWTFILPI